MVEESSLQKTSAIHVVLVRCSGEVVHKRYPSARTRAKNGKTLICKLNSLLLWKFDFFAREEPRQGKQGKKNGEQEGFFF